MKRIYLIFLFLIIGFYSEAQKTFIPDDNFEQVLINLNLDDIFDDSVLTSAIDTVSTLLISNYSISSLIGIEDFIALKSLFCSDNYLDTLDLRFNVNLETLNCRDNLLSFLDVRNGNNISLLYFTSLNNPNLSCIAVNDIAYANANWEKDVFCVFSSSCNISNTMNINKNKKILKIVDVFGREVKQMYNIPLFYIYEDGSVSKKIVFK